MKRYAKHNLETVNPKDYKLINTNINKMKKHSLLALLSLLLMTSCSTYYLTTKSLEDQLKAIDPNKIEDNYDFRLGLIGVALKGEKNFYNGIDQVKCTDKNGEEKNITVTTNTGIRLTDKTGKKQSLYFDSLFLRDSLVYGSKSHFITLTVDPINLKNLTKIEIQ